MQVCFLRDIISDGNGEVGDADACRGVAVHQRVVPAEAVFAGAVFAVAAVGAEANRRRDERPVEVIPAAQFSQKLTRGVGTVVDFFGEIRGVNNLHAGGDVEAARTADNEQVRHARTFGGGEDGGVAVAEIQPGLKALTTASNPASCSTKPAAVTSAATARTFGAAKTLPVLRAKAVTS